MAEILILSFVSTAIAVGFWALIDPWFRLIVQICYGLVEIFIRKLWLHCVLSFQIFWIKRSHDHYVKVANEILKERARANEKSSQG